MQVMTQVRNNLETGTSELQNSIFSRIRFDKKHFENPLLLHCYYKTFSRFTVNSNMEEQQNLNEKKTILLKHIF